MRGKKNVLVSRLFVRWRMNAVSSLVGKCGTISSRKFTQLNTSITISCKYRYMQIAEDIVIKFFMYIYLSTTDSIHNDNAF